jgi:signal transduction histidine kinase
VSLIRPLAEQHNIVVTGPEVSCATHVLGDRERLRIKVTDTGLGIPPEALGRLFVPFERVLSRRPPRG